MEYKTSMEDDLYKEDRLNMGEFWSYVIKGIIVGGTILATYMILFN